MPVLLAVSGMALQVGNAGATLDMTERESVQTIVWITEAVTAVTIAVVFWFVWRVSKKAQANRKTKQEDSMYD